MNKLSVHKDKKLSNNHYLSVARTVLAPNTDLWKLNVLLNYYELFPVGSGTSHEPNTSDGTRIELRTGLKRALN